MYSIRWLVSKAGTKNPPKLLKTGVRIFGGFPPHITGGFLGKHNSGSLTLRQLIDVLHNKKKFNQGQIHQLRNSSLYL
jgi:hypothetical protein